MNLKRISYICLAANVRLGVLVPSNTDITVRIIRSFMTL